MEPWLAYAESLSPGYAASIAGVSAREIAALRERVGRPLPRALEAYFLVAGDEPGVLEPVLGLPVLFGDVRDYYLHYMHRAPATLLARCVMLHYAPDGFDYTAIENGDDPPIVFGRFDGRPNRLADRFTGALARAAFETFVMRRASHEVVRVAPVGFELEAARARLANVKWEVGSDSCVAFGRWDDVAVVLASTGGEPLWVSLCGERSAVERTKVELDAILMWREARRIYTR